MSSYKRSDFTPLGQTKYGICLHWTTWTPARDGKHKPFGQAVEDFNVQLLVDQVASTGAGHFMITLTHADHTMPCPNPELDKILSGRTCERDLVMELADALAARGIKMMLYYNHGTWQNQDPEWQKAVGSREDDRARYYDNYCNVLACLGERYGDKVIAWWFDSGYEHDRYKDTPWARFTDAAKAGNPGRLVTYNAGVTNFHLYTECQDYWCGEVDGLAFQPGGGALAPNGLPWYSLVTWHGYDRYCRSAVWGLERDPEKNGWMKWPGVGGGEIYQYLRPFAARGGAVTYNLACYQDGSIYEPDLKAMAKLNEIMKERNEK